MSDNLSGAIKTLQNDFKIEFVFIVSQKMHTFCFCWRYARKKGFAVQEKHEGLTTVFHLNVWKD